MATRTIVEAKRVTLADGTTIDVCCGPRALSLLCRGGIAVETIGVSRRGVCHHGAEILRAEVLAAEREAYDYEAVYQALRWR